MEKGGIVKKIYKLLYVMVSAQELILYLLEQRNLHLSKKGDGRWKEFNKLM
jgi:hypothetical protein